MIRIAQVNADRAKVVMGEVREIIVERKIDVMLLQEPYVVKGKVIGFGSSYRVVQHVRGERPWAAVVIANENIGVMKVQNLCNSHCVCVELMLPDKSRLCVCSLYCQYSKGIEQFLEMLRVIKRKLRGEKVLVGLDANARSKWWGVDDRDERGMKLEDVIVVDEWWVLNDIVEGPTFETTRGSSYIDVTLSSVDMEVKWNLYDWTSSAHKMILMDIVIDKSAGNRRKGVEGKEDKVFMFNFLFTVFH